MKKLISGYIFNPSSGLVTLTDYSGISLDNLLLITNVSSGQIIYNFADPNAGATIYNSNTFRLEYATSGVMNSGDKLQIFYDVPIEKRDLASGYLTGYITGSGTSTGLYSPVTPIEFMTVGGRAVDMDSGFYPGYQRNDPVSFNFDKNLGGALALQADLDKDIDSVTSFPAGYSSVSNYLTGLITTVNASGIAPIPISGNYNRITLFIQNMGDTVIYGKYGAGASSDSFNFTLNPASGWKMNNGEKWIDTLYKGDVSLNVASGQSGLYMAWEGV